MYKRTAEDSIEDFLAKNTRKILFIWGPRRSGKTTLLTKIGKDRNVRIFNFDFISEREYFINDKTALDKLVKESPLILIDEVQNYPESTVVLKILADQYNVKIIATGSSELRKKSQDFDSLAGRYDEIFCLPLSIEEFFWEDRPKGFEESRYYFDLSKNVMLYGCYPEVNNLGDSKEKIDILQKILDAYVLKDIVDIYNLHNAKLAKDILIKLALQIGQEVSFNEIANTLGANVSTVSSYIEIFVKNYILIPLPSFKTNMRRAVSLHRKYYFYDLGLRNILVKDFRELELRVDSGNIFENFIISEFEKKKRNYNLHQSFYFYREYGGREVDFVIEDFYKKYECYEIKLNKDTLPPKIFPLEHKLAILNNKNYYSEVLKTK